MANEGQEAFKVYESKATGRSGGAESVEMEDASDRSLTFTQTGGRVERYDLPLRWEIEAVEPVSASQVKVRAVNTE